MDVLPETGLRPDTRHRFRTPATPRVEQVRLDIYPDGGMARLRLIGDVAAEDLAALALRWFNALPDRHARQVLAAANVAPDAADRLLCGRPLTEPGTLPASWWTG